jgi:cyclopropane-fatty-acyl-phospholipid synthase
MRSLVTSDASQVAEAPRSRLAVAAALLLGPDAPVEVVLFDGSRVGPRDADARIVLRSRRALSYLAWAPGALGLARAYVSGEIDVAGDMYTVLSRLTSVSRPRSLGWAARLRAAAALVPYLSERPQPPPEEMRINRLLLHGRRHSKRRDRRVISHHYDVPNSFYALVLGSSMSYTCACFPHDGATLEEAQFAKHDLIARKLGLQPGMRLLDVGCGWGGMVVHAAEHYGVEAVGVTLTPQHVEWAQRAIDAAGVSDRARVLCLDYRDLEDGSFDAISSMGLTEHIGKGQLPTYFARLYSKLRPGGRLLNQSITRPDNRQPAYLRRGLVNRFVFPDGELAGPGHLVSLMHDAGFEVRHEENLREHYPRTLAAWSRNLDANWDQAIAEAGEGRARVWRLYMAFARIGFERNRLQLHQVLVVKPEGDGSSGMPLRPRWT